MVKTVICCRIPLNMWMGPEFKSPWASENAEERRFAFVLWGYRKWHAALFLLFEGLAALKTHTNNSCSLLLK